MNAAVGAPSQAAARMRTTLRVGILIAAIATVAILAASAKRSEVYLLTH